MGEGRRQKRVKGGKDRTWERRDRGRSEERERERGSKPERDGNSETRERVRDTRN